MLPGHIQAVKESGVPVVWQCDGVHGNGVVASNKLKTRKLADIMTEIQEARVHILEYHIYYSIILVFCIIL